MDVRLSPEQRALRTSVTQVVDRLGPSTVAALDDHERRAKLDAAVAATGWRELRAPADEEGEAPLASGVEVALVAEELGRGLADVAFLGPTLAAELRRAVGAPPATSPETVALDAPLAAIATTDGGAPPRGTVAVDAAGAAAALVLIPSPGGHVLGQVDLDAGAATSAATGTGSRPDPDPAGRDDGDTDPRPAGAESRPGPAGAARTGTDLTRAVVALDPGAEVRPAAVASRALSEGARTRVAALGLAVTCADLVGTMQGAVRRATDYAGDRRQYGRAVGSFQAVQHLLADALVATEGARSVALHAAWAVDARPPAEALAAASVAKAWCARAARTVCEIAVQVHGGIGNTWECLAHVQLRRALLSTDLFGGVGPSLARVLAHRGIDRVDRGIGAGSGVR